MSEASPSRPPGVRAPLVAARWFSRLAWAAPLLVLLAISLHAWLQDRRGALERQRALVGRVGLGATTLTPSGRTPRDGPGSHAAIDLRHDPRLPSFGRSQAVGDAAGRGR